MRRRDPDDWGYAADRPDRDRGRFGRHYSIWAMLAAGLAVTLAAVLVGGSLTVYFTYRSDWASIKRVKVHNLEKHRPPKLNNALNILLIGSDSRSGGHNAKLGGHNLGGGQRSDTVMLVHLSPGGRRAVILSFPRDSVVPIDQCDSGSAFPGQQAQPPGYVEPINDTFAYGGPSCLWKTVEQTTHIHLDDFVELNFTGFVRVINALGGVNVCLPYPVSGLQYDPTLHLKAGLRHIWGVDALDFWRAREGLGLGSDLQRIQRDQLLLVSLLHGLLREKVLSSYSKTTAVLQAAAGALTTDTGLTQQRMLQIAASLRGIASGSVQFIKVPVVGYTGNANWVQWPYSDAQLFSAIARDVALPKQVKGKPAKLLSPAKVSLKVLNGSGVTGIAGTAASALAHRGFHVTGTGDVAGYGYTTSVVEYGSAASRAAAQTVAAQLSAVTIKPVTGLPAGTVELIVGSTFTALKTHSTAPPASGNLAHQYGGITGGANICKANGSAFQK